MVEFNEKENKIKLYYCENLRKLKKPSNPYIHPYCVKIKDLYYYNEYFIATTSSASISYCNFFTLQKEIFHLVFFEIIFNEVTCCRNQASFKCFNFGAIALYPL